MPENNSKSTSQAGRIPVWLGILIIIIIALIAWLIINGVLQKPIELPEESANIQVTAPKTSKPKLPDEIFSYIGTITKIEPGKIILEAKAAKNYLEKDTNLTILLTDKTKYLKIGVPKTLPKDLKEGESTSLFSREEISFTDLKVGDEITVVSDLNIKDKTEFEVVRVEVTVVK